MHSRQTAVVVDDDPDVRLLLAHVLGKLDLDVTSAETGEDGIARIREVDADLVTLDLTLPDLDGVEVCRRIREFSDAYVVMITGRVEEADRLVGLDVGADDYMTKPVSPREVRARAAALLRRPRQRRDPAAEPPPAPTGLAVQSAGVDDRVVDAGGGLVLVPVRHVALLDGQPLPLTPTEVDLLATLSSRPGAAWDRGALVREVWAGDFIESDFLVDVHVASLRRKLRKAGTQREWISTVAGTGYRFDRVVA
ncbi:response regulator transcription factor [Nocardioides lianchengensis]|uniref:DNA-binding response regulator, OmpR family, contains REC and winged-helix (WHTH) domain n=1 Tax=Nocardioides lianchengensis TaxID=1045774 RepID=A0A1G6RGH3_9ACTN|nr:response regulator transcription factor [Nocardioides lianchengensis]NYG10262.1 DNA-binding response OmpR family regulator [Nocardioides lianchengensis]SDD03006.1 DNA-binding response regulator, OmpR family, contains REC and winged-helix (wHTH) domain [Nocardioides lianchengensis]